jgi:peroxiredoxin
MFSMALIKTPICEFGKKAENFQLKSTNNKIISLNDFKGENGTLIMFICNHCPYVKAVIEDIIQDCKNLEKIGVKSLAVSSNDVKNYPEDSFENMIKFSQKHNFSFPYLFDETQKIAKTYNAVCTPDFFGYNKNLKLQYRGRIRELKELKAIRSGDSDLYKAMIQIAKTDRGPENQVPSMGCSIKWLNN